MHTRTCRPLALTLSLLLGVALAAHAGEATDRASLEAARTAWVAAFNARDADAMAALATDDIVLLAPDAAPVRGREAVRAVWREEASGAKVKVTATTEETVIAGEFAWMMGAFTHTLPNGTKASRGKFLEIWKRVGGRWKIHRDMFSSNAATTRSKFGPMPRPSEPVLDSPRVN